MLRRSFLKLACAAGLSAGWRVRAFAQSDKVNCRVRARRCSRWPTFARCSAQRDGTRATRARLPDGQMKGGKDVLLSRRALIATAAAAFFPCLPGSSRAQQHKIPLLGWLSSTPGSNPLLDAFRAGLRELNYVEGRSIRVEARSAQDTAELRALAQELVRQQVDVIVANGRAATRAAQEATATLPIVMAPVDDPYEFVASLARPSGNITGLALQQTDIDAKQIEILKETVPSLSRLVIFYYYGEILFY
jgi:ABC transporter substrate binding protein